MTFVKIFICEVCDFKSKGFESHEMHFKDIHEDIKFTPACIFNHCEYESEIPVELVKHYSTKHKKAIEKHNLNRESVTIDMAIGTAMFLKKRSISQNPSEESCFHSVQISRNEKELKQSD